MEVEVADEEVTEVTQEGAVEEDMVVVVEVDMEDMMEVRFFNTHLLFCYASFFVSTLSAAMHTLQTEETDTIN